MAGAANPPDQEPDAAHVLVAEDDETTREVIRFVLERSGLRVTVACDGDEAWKAVQAQSFQLIIADISMPGMGGVELISRIRGVEGCADLPVIIVTAKAFEFDSEAVSQELGVAKIHYKPFSPTQLVYSVREVLGQIGE